MTTSWEQSHVDALKEVVDENSEYYLGEITEELLLKISTLYSPSAISKVLHYDLHTCLQRDRSTEE